MVSRDIFVQDLPMGISRVQDIPEDWRPEPLPFGRAEVLEAVRALAPNADVTDPGWMHVSLIGFDVEVSVAEASPLRSFALHVRAAEQGAANAWIGQLLDRLGARALDSDSNTGLFAR